MEDYLSFGEVLGKINEPSKRRDPKSARISSVALALSDVIQNEGGEVTAAKMYASAIAALDGTLHQSQGETDKVIESMSTQAALMEILVLAIPHVAPATLAATMAPTSRTIRGILASTLTIGGESASGFVFDTKDGLGYVTSVLVSSCKASAEFIRHLPREADKSQVSQFFQSALFTFLNDKRPRLKKVVRDSVCGLLYMDSPVCHPGVPSTVNKYIDLQLKTLGQNKNGMKRKELMDLLGFLQVAVMSLDFVSIGSKLMEMLLAMFEELSSVTPDSHFISAPSKNATETLTAVNGVLSTVLALLEHEFPESRRTELDNFAARVLASLVQVNQVTIFRNADTDIISTGCVVFGQVLLCTAQKLLVGDPVKGCKLFPLAISCVLKLSSLPVVASDGTVADALFAELGQIVMVDVLSVKKSDPQKHAACCRASLVAMQGILQLEVLQANRSSLLALSQLIQQMDLQDAAVSECVKAMLKIRSTFQEDKQARAVDEAISSLVQGIGIEQFWRIIDFNAVCRSGVSSQHISLVLKILRATTPTTGKFSSNLEFFHAEVVPLARNFDSMSINNPSDSITLRNHVVDLWSLFPSFCFKPADLSQTLPQLAPILVRAMSDERYPSLVIVISDGLTLLAKGVAEQLAESAELIEEEGFSDVRQEGVTMQQLSGKLLPSLFKLVDTIHKRDTMEGDSEFNEGTSQQGGTAGSEAAQVLALTNTIAALAKVGPPATVQSLFSNVVQRLLEAQQANKDLSGKLCSLLSLSQALLLSETLDQSSLQLLYRSLKPLIRTDETPPRVQKRAYKVLAEICKRGDFVESEDRLKDLLELLTSSSSTSQVAARFMRIKCLEAIVSALSDDIGAKNLVISSLLGEALLCLKDSNKRTRDASYRLLLNLSSLSGDISSFVRSVTAAIASETTHMRSAAVMALTRIMFEHGKEDLELQGLLPSVLKTVLVLSDDPSREVIKSLIGFVRVAVACLEPEALQALLPDVINGLLKYGRGKDRFRAKIKIIIKKLVRTFGYDLLMPLIPANDTRLLLHMKKLSEREARRKQSRRQQGKEKPSHFDDVFDSDEEDSDDGRTLITATTRKTKASALTGMTNKRRHSETRDAGKNQASMRIANDRDGDVLDVQELTTKMVRFNEAPSDSDSESNVNIEFDASGKLVVTDDFDEEFNDETNEIPLVSKVQSTKKQVKDDSSKKGRKNQALGRSYKSKKAGGDVKKKGQKYDPYAYVPLDGRSFTRKNRRHAVEEMGSVVRRDKKRQRR